MDEKYEQLKDFIYELQEKHQFFTDEFEHGQFDTIYTIIKQIQKLEKQV
jgi:hypothetical protein